MEGKGFWHRRLLRAVLRAGLVLLLVSIAVVNTTAEGGSEWASPQGVDHSISLSDSALATPDIAQTAGSPSPWPMIQGSAQHTGLSAFIGPSAADLKWRYAVGARLSLSPVIAGDGTVYLATDNGYLYAVRSDGTLWWRTRVAPSLCASPALAPDGTLYVGTDEGSSSAVCAVSPSGEQIWRFRLGAPSHTPLTVGPDGTVYAGTDEGYLYAISPGGLELWRFDSMTLPMRPRLDSAAALAPDGTVYVGSGSGYLHAIAPDGSALWKVLLASLAIRTTPAIGHDGTIVCASDAGCLHVVSPAGELITICGGSLPYPCDGLSSPAVAADGTIYLAVDAPPAGELSGAGFLGAYQASGSTRWEYALGGGVHSSPTIGADGTVYIGADDGVLYAIRANGTLLWRFTTTAAIRASPALAADGTLYVASENGNLYALGRPENRQPSNGNVSPYHGGSSAGEAIQFTTTWSDPDSWADVRNCYFVLGSHVRSPSNVFLSYDPVANRVYLANDAGTEFMGGLEPGSEGEIANSRARLLVSGTRAVRDGPIVEVTWSLALSETAPAVKSLYLRCDDRSGHSTHWAIRGSWTVY